MTRNPQAPQTGSTILVAIHTIGCRANQADSALIEAHLKSWGWPVVPPATATVVVINSCCVTQSAQRDCKKVIRRYLRQKKQVLLCGCAVSAIPEFVKEVADLGVQTVGSGKTRPEAVARHIVSELGGSGVWDGGAHGDTEGTYFSIRDAQVQPVANVGGRTRALLKIQTGCSHGCAYCIVPRARGTERSMPLAQMLKRVEAIQRTGARELVLTGVQIGAWGTDTDEGAFHHMLATVAAAFSPGRVRLSSIEPWSVNQALAETLAHSPNICAHLHIPLQSGDDAVLKDMRRGYSSAQFAEMVLMVRRVLPHVAIGTDVICGFPTEDAEAFDNTLSLLKIIRPAYVHGFSYSDRTGTVAHRTFGPGNRQMARERIQKLQALGDSMSAQYRDASVGRRCEVLVEDVERGLTDTFLQVKVTAGATGRLVWCELEPPLGESTVLRARPLAPEGS